MCGVWTRIVKHLPDLSGEPERIAVCWCASTGPFAQLPAAGFIVKMSGHLSCVSRHDMLREARIMGALKPPSVCA